MIYDKPITIQIQDEYTEQWKDMLNLHAYVNKTKGGQELAAGALQSKSRLTFKIPYVSALEKLAYSTQPYRIIYRGRKFKVIDYDDYMERHREIKLVGEFYE
ncbi:MAG: phage head closure protein [Acutalibacteraceae bacterium]